MFTINTHVLQLGVVQFYQVLSILSSQKFMSFADNFFRIEKLLTIPIEPQRFTRSVSVVQRFGSPYSYDL